MRPTRYLAFAGTLLLLGATAWAHAAIIANVVSGSALASSSLTSNELATTGSAIADLNGVSVEAITLPPASRR